MLEDIRNERLKKLSRLRAAGIDPYPAEVKRTRPIGEILRHWEKYENKKTINVVGRILAIRGQGGVMFFDLIDEAGAIQIVFRKDQAEKFDLIQANLDIGDFIQASGQALVTRRGEKSVEARKVSIIAKTLRPIPSSWYKIQDPETRQRQRYLDLLLTDETRELFRKKALFWTTIRSFLVKNGFLEVETPVLEHIPGGADAEPFKTKYKALDIEMYLRISLEIALKKIMVGGFERVFEIGRIFRNEGIDAEHLQDYTQMELYWAYQDYDGLMTFVEKMYALVVRALKGEPRNHFQGQILDWAGPWPRIEYFEIFQRETGLDLDSVSEEKLAEFARGQGIDVSKHPGRGRLIDAIFKKIRSKLIQPCFLINPPVDIEPLAKRLKPGSNKVARFQVIAAGTELGKGFSELNDPIDQRARFEEQERLRARGDAEAQRLDESFIEAMEYGLPPMAGFGVSERLFSVILEKPVRETVIFPTLKPKN